MLVVRDLTADDINMEQKGLRTGHIVALVGALATLLSLWRPWYSLTFPPQLRELMGSGGQLGSDPGLLGQLSRGLAASLPASVEASGWKELGGADVTLFVLALGALLLSLAAGGVFGGVVKADPYACGSVIAGAGGAAAVLVVVHIVHKPGGSAASQYVTLSQGIWIAAVGAGLMLAGGLMAASRPSTETVAKPTTYARLDPELPPVFTPAPGTGAASVPPPGA